MKLETEIQTDVPFHDEQEKAIVNIVYTYNVMLETTLAVLKPFKLNDQHYNILKILEAAGPQSIPVSDVRRNLLNKRSDLTRLVDKLVKMEWVHREVNPEDRRSVELNLTQAGYAQLQEIDAEMEVHRTYANNLSQQEAKRLNELLDKLRG